MTSTRLKLPLLPALASDKSPKVISYNGLMPDQTSESPCTSNANGPKPLVIHKVSFAKKPDVEVESCDVLRCCSKAMCEITLARWSSWKTQKLVLRTLSDVIRITDPRSPISHSAQSCWPGTKNLRRTLWYYFFLCHIRVSLDSATNNRHFCGKRWAGTRPPRPGARAVQQPLSQWQQQ